MCDILFPYVHGMIDLYVNVVPVLNFNNSQENTVYTIFVIMLLWALLSYTSIYIIKLTRSDLELKCVCYMLFGFSNTLSTNHQNINTTVYISVKSIIYSES